ncbi:glutaredoxin domain-containing protein [Streptacidiphilus cavernicola]|uniref:Glutaredoxin domain-containing protein n=1 Tax=Streptacidiphilus cavernicola TaxID=3342716 RepID=A0ABV6VSL8_9ACTN
MIRVWVPSALVLLAGSIVAAWLISSGHVGTGAVLLAVYLALAAAVSPLIFPRSVDNAEARRRAEADGRPIVFWRPGCTYCMRLRMRLGRDARRAHWVNIWRDAAAAETVRQVNDGNETVPTVVLAGRPHTNPDPAWLREQLRSLV